MPDVAVAELIASYVPRLIRERLVFDPASIASPFTKSFQAVTLFADISGFTTLTERLVEKGPSGVERIAAILNEYFGQLIDLVYDYGGDVVKFAARTWESQE